VKQRIGSANFVARFRRADIIEGVCGNDVGVQSFQHLGISRQLCGKDNRGNTGACSDLHECSFI